MILLKNIQFGDITHKSNLNNSEYGLNLFIDTYSFTKSVFSKDRFVIIDNSTIPNNTLIGGEEDNAGDTKKYYT